MKVFSWLITLLLTLFLYNSTVLAQSEGERCGSTMQAHQDQLDNNPEYRNRVKEWEKKTAPIIENRQSGKNPTCTNGPIIVPVAVHFDNGLVSAANEACAITIVEDQIAELNLEMLGQDVDASQIGNFASCFGAGILGDACIEFCIATQNHPTGYGLAAGDPAITFGQVSFNIPGNNYTPVNSDWSGYVNIYVDNLSGGLLGVSNGIPGGFNGDGVLVDNCVFGTGNINCTGVQTTGSGGCTTLYDEGETLAHEIGHYFGLFHIWGDNFNCNGNQDGIADTPDMANNYSGYSSCGNHTSCANLPQTCGDEDMYMNFMSYASDGCMYMFTSDQSDVMYATAIAEGYTTSNTLCSPPAPVAAFTPTGAFNLCSPDCEIAYADQSTNSPDMWDWDFVVTAGDITLDKTSSNIQFPEVCVLSGTSGTITTTLTASNAGGSDMITQTLNVTVTTLTTWYADADGDGFGDPMISQTDCNQPTGYVTDNTDCDDNDANNFPGNTEVCDGADNNCDGNIDEGLTTTYYADSDGDGYGDPSNSVNDCTAPTGYVTDNTDCDDNDANNFPGNTEVCDGADNNCDGNIDEGLTTTYYADSDGDGYGDPSNSVNDCTAPTGYVTDNTDCDDNDANNFPGNTEVCDGADNNCDGNIDEGLTTTYYADGDGDGYGDPSNSVNDCTAPTGYVTDNTDCDDNDANNFPGNTEVCDGADNNCDGVIDEGCMTFTCDADYLVINTITNTAYHAEINISSDALVDGGGSVLYTAGTDIDLLPGFEVVLGTEFEARIQPCVYTTPSNNNGNTSFWEGFNSSSKTDKIAVNVYSAEGSTIKTIIIRDKSTPTELSNQLKGLDKGFYRVTYKVGAKEVEKSLLVIK